MGNYVGNWDGRRRGKEARMEEGTGETLMATGGSCSVSEVRAWINLRKYLPEKNEVSRSLKAT